MQPVVVVIPVYNPNPSASELFSFKQCFNILNQYPIIILAPDNMDLKKYEDTVAGFKTISIPPVWQSGLLEYNKLKVSTFFYELFKEYEYLLTYELDAFVFKNELQYWWKRSFDYIGAPWFEGLASPISNNIIGVGNSGFSLRNVQSCLRILKRIHYLKSLRTFWFKSRLQALIRFSTILSGLKTYFHIQSISELDQLFFDNELNEDFYWTRAVAKAFDDYRVAPIDDACKFSFDANPAFLFKRNKGELPFGCHAWERHEPEFWKQFIPVREQSVL
ncbi:MAG: hypothetical protein JWR61_5306 [Ferruginibacter sp.]|uniref:DUF5672 family protein n=1 Tax=Ferruginibacter sp. TaxID=1940288 RepID=UPI00265857F8|nr:DUF5672 family protein [Ferruginibacter sp.]MDB5280351.1 hypothetical protein [Ferruginibacter sp.]